MSNLSIKDVAEAWAETLRQRALRKHRSLQGELMAIIEQTVALEAAASTLPQPPASGGARQGTVVGLDRRGHPIMRYGWKTTDQVSAEMRAKYPRPIADAPLGVDIIREYRDSR